MQSPNAQMIDDSIGVGPRLCLAALPILSIAVQVGFGSVQGTTDQLFQHYTITYVDLVLIPFNYFAAKDIDWKKGFSLFVLSLISVLLNIVAHAFWQHTGVDNGHMIRADKVVQSAGWAHVAYSIVQMTLVAAFLFLRTPSTHRYTPATIFAAFYFVAAAISGYAMHSEFLLTDLAMTLTGFALLFGGPWLLPTFKLPSKPTP